MLIIKKNVYLLSLYVLCSCANNGKEKTYKVPDVPVLTALPDKYVPVNTVDTAENIDLLPEKKETLIMTGTYMTQDSIKLYGLDTMQFHHPSYYTDIDNGYSWLFSNGFLAHYTRDGEGAEKEVYSEMAPYATVTRYVARKSDGLGERNGTFDFRIYAVVIGTRRKNDQELFVKAYPLIKKVRIADYWSATMEKDSVPVPNYEDKIDSAHAVYMNLSITK